jgi:hypothetical protein
MRARAFSTAVRLARDLCMSQPCLPSIVWELVAESASAGKIRMLASMRAAQGTLCRPDGLTIASDQAERLVRIMIPGCSSSSQIAVSPVRFQVLVRGG